MKCRKPLNRPYSFNRNNVQSRKPEVSVMKSCERKRIKVFLFLLLTAGLAVLILTAASGADFVPQTSVFSAPKNPPAGFSQIVEPNVLLLIDTSGSMTFFMDNDSST